MALAKSWLRMLVLPLPVLTTLGLGCGTDAVGIDACRRIEAVRCSEAPSCKGDADDFGVHTEEQVANCISFYSDQCLHGLENAEDEPKDSKVDSCVKAIEVTAKCKRDGVATMAGCEGVDVEEGGGDLSPCAILTEPELLSSCTFAIAPAEEK